MSKITKLCPVCNRYFTTKHNARKYCKLDCRNKSSASKKQSAEYKRYHAEKQIAYKNSLLGKRTKRAYLAKESTKILTRAASKRWREKEGNFKKAKAQKIYFVWRTRRGIKRQPCSKCSNVTAFAHHEDYDKPLGVVWLCAKHHREAHLR